MGGRGGSSGLSPSSKSGLIDASQMPKLTGSEKQIKWAEQIRENAINTVNKNIELAIERNKQYGKQTQIYADQIESYNHIGKQLGEELKKIDSASVLINRRDTFSGQRINMLAQKLEEAYKKKRKK